MNTPKHCKSCIKLYVIERTKEKTKQKYRLSWCCKFGKKANSIVGHCININGKEEK